MNSSPRTSFGTRTTGCVVRSTSSASSGARFRSTARRPPITSSPGAAGAVHARAAVRSRSTSPPSKARAGTRRSRMRNTRDWQSRPSNWGDSIFTGTGFGCCLTATPTTTGSTSNSDERRALTTIIFPIGRCSGRWRSTRTGIVICWKRPGERGSRRTRRIASSGRFFGTSFFRWRRTFSGPKGCTPRHSICESPSSREKTRQGNGEKGRFRRERESSRPA